MTDFRPFNMAEQKAASAHALKTERELVEAKARVAELEALLGDALPWIDDTVMIAEMSAECRAFRAKVSEALGLEFPA